MFHRKGVAIHPDPESCMASREALIEALTGAHVGRVLSCEIIAIGVPTSFSKAEGHTDGGVIASLRPTLRSCNSSPPVSETDLRCHETGVQCRDGVCTEVGPELVPRARVTV